MFNSLKAKYKTPFGAAKAGEPVRFTVTLPKSDLRTPRLLVTRAGEDRPLTLTASRTEGGDGFWDYRVSFTPREPGLYFYRFVLWVEGGEKMALHRKPDGSAGWGDGPLWQLTVCDPDYHTPDIFKGRAMMQIFPDRFCKSGEVHRGVPEDRKLHASWEERPQSVPDPDGEYRCNDYFGGDLRGIIEKLDDIEALGIGILYLNPIFEAHSNHRYNTANYMKIDPMLGTEADFIELCREAHRRDILIVLDGVFNHTGSDSVYFNREGRYGEGGAYRDPESPYHDWYSWWDFESRDYDSWWGFLTLPNVNEQCESYREFICGENGVLRRWLRLGADGWRLDVVDEIPDFFVREMRAAVKAEKPYALLMGEVWEDASNKQSYGEQRQYLMGEELDSVMNYPLRRAILRFLREGDGIAFRDAAWELLEHYPREVTECTMNGLSSHDVPRAITALGGLPMDGHDRDWQRQHNTLSVGQYYRGRQLFMLGTMMTMCWPGCPSIYYGDDAGLTGYADPFNRGPYPWGHEDEGLRACIAQLTRMRREHPALQCGSIRPLAFGQDTAAWIREDETEALLFAVNRGETPQELPPEFAGEPVYTIGHWEGGTLLAESAVLLRQRKETT